MNDPDEFDIESFRDVIRSHWVYHGLCNMMNWAVFTRDDSVTQIEIAPAFQIIYGGAEDGKKVWTPFEFDIVGFLNEPDLDEIQECGAMTYSLEESTGPFIGAVGTYRGKQFAMQIYLEPDPSTVPLELVDRIRNEVRNITGESS